MFLRAKNKYEKIYIYKIWNIKECELRENSEIRIKPMFKRYDYYEDCFKLIKYYYLYCKMKFFLIHYYSYQLKYYT